MNKLSDSSSGCYCNMYNNFFIEGEPNNSGETDDVLEKLQLHIQTGDNLEFFCELYNQITHNSQFLLTLLRDNSSHMIDLAEKKRLHQVVDILNFFSGPVILGEIQNREQLHYEKENLSIEKMAKALKERDICLMKSGSLPKMEEAFQRTINWIAFEIVSQCSEKLCHEQFCKFLDLGTFLMKEGNYHGARQVAEALRKPAVLRLNLQWSQDLENLMDLLSPENNVLNYIKDNTLSILEEKTGYFSNRPKIDDSLINEYSNLCKEWNELERPHLTADLQNWNASHLGRLLDGNRYDFEGVQSNAAFRVLFDQNIYSGLDLIENFSLDLVAGWPRSKQIAIIRLYLKHLYRV